jgi:hypothetical protein
MPDSGADACAVVDGRTVLCLGLGLHTIGLERQSVPEWFGPARDDQVITNEPIIWM